jgi:hypothetical protein
MEKTKLIRCINSSWQTTTLEIGKEYWTISEQVSTYKIECGWFPKELFEEVEQEKTPYILTSETYDFINPNHYKQGDKETWEKMLEIWGKEAFIIYCQMNSYKYMQRLGKKPDNPIEQDLKKAKWYLDKAHDLKN